MEKQTVKLMFALLRSAVFDNNLTDGEREMYSEEKLPELLALSKSHDLSHLLAYSLKKNGLSAGANGGADRAIFTAAYRYERLKYDYDQLCAVLEAEKIPFIPLKGSVLRDLYPEPWMRTSCDIDILVHSEDLERGIACLVRALQYEEKERESHDVSLFSPGGTHLELHFDLVEEGSARGANDVLNSVWNNVFLHEQKEYWYEMTDAFFYFYHIAHMAKHFEVGGCGIRPLIDLRILDHMENADHEGREKLLEQADLVIFTQAARRLSEVWFGGAESDPISESMEHFILHGGVYGTIDNRVALQQQKTGGRFGYLFSRIFMPYIRLKRYYPVLEKHRWLTPVMQVRRWFRLLRPDVRRRAKGELNANGDVERSRAEEMQIFLENIGL